MNEAGWRRVLRRWHGWRWWDMPTPKDQGRIVRYVTKRLNGGGKYMRCEVMEKPGPQGGRTVCGPVRTKRK